MMGRFLSFPGSFYLFCLKRTAEDWETLRMRLLIDVMSDFHWKSYFKEPSMQPFCRTLWLKGFLSNHCLSVVQCHPLNNNGWRTRNSAIHAWCFVNNLSGINEKLLLRETSKFPGYIRTFQSEEGRLTSPTVYIVLEVISFTSVSSK